MFRVFGQLFLQACGLVNMCLVPMVLPAPAALFPAAVVGSQHTLERDACTAAAQHMHTAHVGCSTGRQQLASARTNTR
jgi:hypothetical protein